MEKLDICYTPRVGDLRAGDGRRRNLAYSVERLKDGRFLDQYQGQWVEFPVLAKLKELGRDDGRFKALKGCYVPNKPINLGPESLGGTYRIRYHSTDHDNAIIGDAVQHVLVSPPLPQATQPDFGELSPQALEEPLPPPEVEEWSDFGPEDPLPAPHNPTILVAVGAALFAFCLGLSLSRR